MIRQRPTQAAPAVQALAGELPFRDAAFDAALAILTIHHWPDWRRGLAELARSARKRVVILTWDPSAAGFWLVNDYLPELLSVDRRVFPGLEAIGGELGRISVSVVPIPCNCTDGFLGAYWQRPDAYLDPAVRNAISTFARVDNVQEGLSRLREDLHSGVWHRRNATLLTESSLDLGYRLVVSH
jgi:SAM-dependent methyltransferase